MEGMKNFLDAIYENWTLIMIFIGIIVSLYNRYQKYSSLSKEEKIESAKKILQETILSYIREAENNYCNIKKSGQIKRAEVIANIYHDYPALSLVADQKKVIEWLDQLIDNSLITLREILTPETGSSDTNE